MTLQIQTTKSATPIPAPAARTKRAAPKTPAKTITELYESFVKAHEAMQATPATLPGKLSNPAFDRAVDKCGNIAWSIVAVPASSIEEMLLKIAVVGWCAGATRTLKDLDRWELGQGDAYGEEHAALVSLRGDLRSIAKCQHA
jgi:hypothetical protein